MSTDSQILEEVVIVGYGSSRSKELTGAAAKVKGENIEKLNLSRMDQALQGQVSGVNISTNSGSPGGASSIRIRGLSTFGDNDPLILVDGVVYDSEGLNALNPADIESVNVLKMQRLVYMECVQRMESSSSKPRVKLGANLKLNLVPIEVFKKPQNDLIY